MHNYHDKQLFTSTKKTSIHDKISVTLKPFNTAACDPMSPYALNKVIIKYLYFAANDLVTM